MARKPSERSKSQSEAVSLNITPYLDIVTSVMLFMLVTSTGLVQIGVINVNAPRYSDPLTQGSKQQDEKEKDEKKLNLTIGITYKGLYIAGVGGVLGSGTEEAAEGEAAEKSAKPTIPLLTNDPACRDALARGVPPPAVCYDYAKLTGEMVTIKDQFPKETKAIIYAQPDVPYDVLVRVMDAIRRDEEGRALFFQVILSPEIA
jgi:biopolymer transport protein TolR